ncbi:MAG: DUF11 domain-containing protein, partial [Longimicrobiales bacterium]|nr:DUF11 domain-containing protein [Longimicrobiales bacterium]
IACSPSAGTTTNLVTGAVSIVLGGGDAIVCTFVNTVAPAPTPDLSITKVGVVTSSAMGQFITYTITVTNNGTASAPGPVTTRDTLPSTPAGVQFSAPSAPCSGPATGPIVCTSGTAANPSAPLAPGAQLTYTITLIVPAGGGTVTNCASVAQGGDAMTPPEPNLANNRACATNTVAAPAATGTITIVKDAQPNDPQNFHFATVGTGLSGFDLDDDADATLPSTKTFTLAAGGTYTVTEDAVAGWTVPSIQCLVAVPGATLTFTDQLNRTFTISNLEAGAVVTCTFINVR